MDLIIVESPTKARTFGKFLEKKTYTITSSMGHVRDLPEKKLGIDVDHEFEPEYVVMPKKKKLVDELVALSKKAKKIILATDPDREGEAIAHHINTILREKLKDEHKFVRISFHEITMDALNEALAQPREVDIHLFDAQQARRIIDRLVGYKVSPYLWKRFSKRWLSAGRVQTVALILIVMRHKEREAFSVYDYFTYKGYFNHVSSVIEAKLLELEGKAIYQTTKIKLFDGDYQYQHTIVKNEQEAQSHADRLKKEHYTVSDVAENATSRSPGAPFTTSTLQQYASNNFGYSPKRTMQIAQSLYEQGLITYHRTDSFNLSEKFITECRGFVKKTYGEQYVAPEARRFKTKSKLAQEAHEAIRPTVVHQGPSSEVIMTLAKDQQTLYKAIFTRSIATQCADAKILKQKITIVSKAKDLLVAEAEEVLFPGFLILESGKTSQKAKPSKIQSGTALELKEINMDKKETQPPPYYSEASLIRTLEEKGIGRPSTYAPILSLIQERQYVRKEVRNLIPTELGIQIATVLAEKFKDFFSVNFTAGMEDELDEIALGNKKWREVVKTFYGPLMKELDLAYGDSEKIKVEETTDEKCPKCGSPVVIKMSRFGKFYACSGFPTCKYTKSFLQQVGIKCPKCEAGNVVVRFSKKKKRFYACDRYPECDFTSLWLPKAKSESAEGVTEAAMAGKPASPDKPDSQEN